MIHAYDKLYLDSAMDTLGAMLDYAVNGCGLELDFFYQLFLASGIDEQMDRGNPKYLCGLSGADLARMVAERTGTSMVECKPMIDMGSPEYWTGWTLAYIHWSLCVGYKTIQMRGMPIRELYIRYSPLHEADVTKSLSFARNALSGYSVKDNLLRRARKNAGLTQRQLAERSGNTLRSIRAYEQGQISLQKAEVASVLNLCQALGCSPRDLLPAV